MSIHDPPFAEASYSKITFHVSNIWSNAIHRILIFCVFVLNTESMWLKGPLKLKFAEMDAYLWHPASLERELFTLRT